MQVGDLIKRVYEKMGPAEGDGDANNDRDDDGDGDGDDNGDNVVSFVACATMLACLPSCKRVDSVVMSVSSACGSSISLVVLKGRKPVDSIDL